MTRVRAAAVQAEPIWFDLDATTTKTVEIIAQASTEGVDLVAFPETWLPGYPLFLWGMPPVEQIPLVNAYRANSPRIDGPEIARIRDAARAHGITVVLGLSERDHGSLYMAQLIVGPDGDVLLHRRKLKPTFVERTLFGEGDGSGLQVIDTPLGRLGALNCWEHLQPLLKFSMYAQHEQIHVGAWPPFGDQLAQLSAEASIAMSRTYAMEGSVFVVMANGVMNNVPGFAGGGAAGIYGPDGSLLSDPLDPAHEGLAVADLDLDAIDVAKVFADPVGHYARPDVFTFAVDRTARPAATVGAVIEAGSTTGGAPAAVETGPDDESAEAIPS